MSKKSRIPKSKAKTAYGLLSEVRALILAEPKRYQQTVWVERQKNRRAKPPEGFPACGTVACVAGWVATLKHGDKFQPNKTAEIASAILGLDDYQVELLFDAGALYDVMDAGADTCPIAQTPEYAALGARHIERFQKKYAQQLKAKAV